MEKEPLNKSFGNIEVEMKNRGFEFAGKEPLVIFGYDTEEKRFRPTSYRSRDEILKEYTEKLGKEVELELVNVPGLPHEEESVYVFAKNDMEREA